MNKQERQQYRQSRILELRETINSCYNEIRIHQDEESMEQNKASVGKCYRYRNFVYDTNNYTNSWWYYLTITSIDKKGNLMGWGFGKDLDDVVRIYLRFDHVRRLSNSYKEITPKQFWTEWQTIKSELDMLMREN